MGRSVAIIYALLQTVVTGIIRWLSEKNNDCPITVNVAVRTTPRVIKRVNAEFRGQWVNAENIGISEEDFIALWNAAHPDDPIES
jgi:hypothetical protein